MPEVFAARCAAYEPAALTAAVERLLAQVFPDGGPLRAGQTVLLKPNLLAPQVPDRAVTTHPLLVETMARACRARGLRVSIGDSPGAGIVKLEQLWEATGMTAAARNSGATLVALETLGGTLQPHAQVRDILISNAVAQYDHIINLPKLKTHALTLMTGAVKNLFGLVPGAFKAEVHRRAPNSATMMRAIRALPELVRPVLTVMDAVVGMEGNGPLGGQPRHLGVLLAGTSPFAVDAVAARLAGFPLASLDYLDGLPDHGAHLACGGDVVPPLDPPFAMPRTFRLNALPAPLLSLASRLVTIRPEFTARCRACGICVKACPAEALALRDGRLQFDRRRCFSCFCCQELCPHDAIGFRRSLLGRFFFRDNRT